MKLLSLATVFALVLPAIPQCLPHRDCVPDAETAVAIAEAVLIPVYGKEHILSERPFRAILKDGVWTVAGTSVCHDGKPQSADHMCKGGTAEVLISKKDAQIIRLGHYK